MASESSMGNLVGLAVARSARAGFDARGRGLAGEARLAVYASSEAHSSIQKAVELLGLGTDGFRKVPVRADFTVDVEDYYHVTAFEDRSDEFRACARGELPHTNHAVIGFAAPLVRVLGPIQEKEENSGLWQPADHVSQELFRGLVDPMEVFEDDQQRLHLALAE